MIPEELIQELKAKNELFNAGKRNPNQLIAETNVKITKLDTAIQPNIQEMIELQPSLTPTEVTYESANAEAEALLVEI